MPCEPFKLSIIAMDYFKLFDLPVGFKVDPKLLRKRFFERSRETHPDRFVNSSSDEQEGVLQSAAGLNTAFKTLKSPDLTIQYVLIQKGLLTPDEKFTLPPDFLMEVMELNEVLSEAQLTDSVDEDSQLNRRLQSFQQELYAPVSEILEHYREGVTSEAELLKVKEYYFKKKYLDRAMARIDQKS